MVIPEEIKDRVVELYQLRNDGTRMTQVEIARALGISDQSVFWILKKKMASAGHWHRKKFSPQEEQRVVEMYLAQNPDGSFNSAAEVARAFDTSTNNVHNIIKRSGHNLRSLSETLLHHPPCKPVKNLPKEGEIAPLCKCGCGLSVTWNKRANRWDFYYPGHYRPDALYKHEDWLRQEYETRHRSIDDIAKGFGVGSGTIRGFMKKFGIKARTTSETLLLNGSVSGPNNPAWKGGVAKWQYPHGWKRIAASIRKRDNYTCQICFTQFPKTSKLLHVHHKDEDKTNCEPDNLVSVCATCHPKGKRGVWVKRVQPERQYVITRRGEIYGLDPAEWLSVKSAAEILAVHRSHIIKLGSLHRYRMEKKGGFWYVERASFEAFAKNYVRGAFVH